jgi:hypothetical protein
MKVDICPPLLSEESAWIKRPFNEIIEVCAALMLSHTGLGEKNFKILPRFTSPIF